MATLRDISKALGLSVTQVSRALNGHEDVSGETRERVLETAKKLNYKPNISARRLVTGRSGIVGLALPDSRLLKADGLFVQLVGGLSRYFSERGLLFVLHIADQSEDIVRVHERLIDSASLDGFVLTEPLVNDPRITYLQGRGVPFVVHGRDTDNPSYPFFDIDNYGVGYRLTERLLQAGHRHIAFLNGNATSSFAEARKQGYLDALHAVGVQPEPGLHRNGEMTESFGLLSSVELWADKAKGPTGIICGNMLIANGVFSALSALNLSVPRDVSVVAHDDDLPVLGARNLPVAVTCTLAALTDGWEALARFLVGKIEGAPLAELQRFGDLRLVEGASVAVPAPSV